MPQGSSIPSPDLFPDFNTYLNLIKVQNLYIHIGSRLENHLQHSLRAAFLSIRSYIPQIFFWNAMVMVFSIY